MSLFILLYNFCSIITKFDCETSNICLCISCSNPFLVLKPVLSKEGKVSCSKKQRPLCHWPLNYLYTENFYTIKHYIVKYPKCNFDEGHDSMIMLSFVLFHSHLHVKSSLLLVQP